MTGQRTFEPTIVQIPIDGIGLEGMLTIPPDATALVVFAHGSGSSRHSPRNRFVSEFLNAGGLGTLLFDLLNAEEQRLDAATGDYRFNIEMLIGRLNQAVDWTQQHPETRELRVGLFGASTGAAAALGTAVNRSDAVGAVVSRGGRPDLAADALPRVKAPTLLIVGGADSQVIELNQRAAGAMALAEHKIEIVPGASHLFEESGKLEEVARLSEAWFSEKLGTS